MSVEERPFAPIYRQTQYAQSGATSTLSQQGQCELSTTVTAVDATAVPSAAFRGTGDNANNQILISNTTSVWVMVNFGAALNGHTVRAATINDMPVAPGAQIVVTVDSEVSGASVFANGAPATSALVIFTRGSGT